MDKTSKLIRILSSFTVGERRRFRDYLTSPFFNKKKEIIDLFQLIDFKKVSGKKSISKEEIIRNLFQKNYKNNKSEILQTDYTRLKSCVSALSQKAENFLLQINFEKYPSDNNRRIIDELMIRKLYPEARNLQKKGEKKLDKTPVHNRQYYYDKYRSAEALFYLDIIENNRSAENFVQKVRQPFLQFYKLNTLAYACAAINQKRILNVRYETSYLDDLDKSLASTYKDMPKLIGIYYTIFQMLKGNDIHKNFQKAIDTLKQEKTNLDTTDIRQCCNFLLNFCQWEIYNGNKHFKVYRFDLYQEYLPTSIWDDGLYFSAHIYYLYVRSALEVAKRNEAEVFIDAYKPKLNPIYQENMCNLCHAEIYYAKRDLNNANAYLAKFLSKEDFFYDIYRKALAIKILYDENKIDEIKNALEALRVYLTPARSPDINESLRSTYLEFRRLAHHLWKCRFEPNDRDKAPALLLKIKEAPKLAEREWLFGKVEELL